MIKQYVVLGCPSCDGEMQKSIIGSFNNKDIWTCIICGKKFELKIKEIN